MSVRVVITGMGVVSPNGVGLSDFLKAIRAGKSGIKYYEELEKLGFSCHLGGAPPIPDDLFEKYFTALQRKGFVSPGIMYGCIAGVDAWRDAGLELGNAETPNYESGTIFGVGNSSAEKFRESIYKLDQGQVRRLGSTSVPQIMASGISAYLAGLLALGNQVTSNSSACSTGTEAVIMAYDRIQSGRAERMLAGACNDHGPYVWGGFDAMKVTNYKSNHDPEAASRPMSATAAGFIPGSGAGALLLESLDSALERGAHIYAEVIGGCINSGGQRMGGSLTAPNPHAVQACIRSAVANAKVHPDQIDAINGHLTATIKDPEEIHNWTQALNRSGKNFPYINSLKSQTGHCLSAAGAIECVATVLQLKHQFLFPNLNCSDPHPEIISKIDEQKIPRTLKEDVILDVIAKASFGFGDVNAVVLFKKY